MEAMPNKLAHNQPESQLEHAATSHAGYTRVRPQPTITGFSGLLKPTMPLRGELTPFRQN